MEYIAFYLYLFFILLFESFNFYINVVYPRGGTISDYERFETSLRGADGLV